MVLGSGRLKFKSPFSLNWLIKCKLLLKMSVFSFVKEHNRVASWAFLGRRPELTLERAPEQDRRSGGRGVPQLSRAWGLRTLLAPFSDVTRQVLP